MPAAKKLTRDLIERLKPASARQEVTDALCPGLRLVIQPSGARSWALRYIVGGRTRKLTLGTYPAVTLEKARAVASAKRGEVLQGRDPAGDKATARAPTNTVLAAFKAYDQGHLSWGRPYTDHETGEVTAATGKPAIGEATAAATRSFFLRRVLPTWGSRAAGSITRQDVVALLDSLKDFKDARRKGKTRLSHFFKYTMDRNATVIGNPAAGVGTGDASKSRDRILTDEELRRVWLACDQVGTFGAMVRTLILTMARRSEVSDMERAELSESIWTTVRTKNGLPLDIHRTPQFNAVLSNLLRPEKGNCRFVFEGRHHDRPIGGFSDLKDKLDAAIGDGVAPWTLHDLRRTGASMMQRLKIPFEVREACLNHKMKGVAGVYNRFEYADEKAIAFEALACEVQRIVTAVPMVRPNGN